MSQNAPGRKTTDLGPNPSGRTQGAPELRASVPGEYDHEGGHPERIRRRKEFASCDRSAQLPLFLELGSAMSVPDREADENSLFTGESPMPRRAPPSMKMAIFRRNALEEVINLEAC
jgi:hypothetical protein